MTDIFISYASEDRERARQFASAFEARGWAVWWDRRIVPGQAFDSAIEQALEAAKCVVVLWSPDSAASEWVKNEAAVGAERGVLVPAMIVPVKLPLEFRRKQTADLTDWRGAADHPGFASLCEAVEPLLGEAPCAPVAPPTLPAPAGGRRLPLLAALAVVLAGGVFWGVSQRAVPPVVPVPAPQSASAGEGEWSAARIAGVYRGAVVADSKGGSRSGVSVTVEFVDRYTVRLTSDYPRIPAVTVRVSQVGDRVLADGGDTALVVDPTRTPQRLDYSPHGELSFSGVR